MTYRIFKNLFIFEIINVGGDFQVFFSLVLFIRDHFANYIQRNCLTNFFF